MKKFTPPHFIAKLRKQWNQYLRRRELQKVNRDYTRRQNAAYKSARSAKKADAPERVLSDCSGKRGEASPGFPSGAALEGNSSDAGKSARFCPEAGSAPLCLRVRFHDCSCIPDLQCFDVQSLVVVQAAGHNRPSGHYKRRISCQPRQRRRQASSQQTCFR